MQRTQPVLILMITLILPASLCAQAWSGIIAPSRATDWSAVGIPGGIPSENWTQCGSTIGPYSGSATTINTAIAQCGNNQYVLLGPGTFNLSSGVTLQSNAVLRGSGADETVLAFSASQGCNGWGAGICLAGSNTYSGGGYTQGDWTASYSQGTTSITLSSVTGIITNVTPIVLDQCDDGFTGTVGSPTCTGSASDNGGIFVCDTQHICASEGPANVPRTHRSQEQIVVATGISGTGPYTVTIAPAIQMPNWGGSGKTPQAWWGSATIQNSGVENLSIDMTGYSDRAVTIGTAKNCWVKGVRSIKANGYHLFNYLTYGDVIRDSYLYYTANSAQQSYGIGGGTDGGLLIENNIMQGVADPVNFDASCSGCVIGYNFAVNQYYSPSLPYMFGMISFHAAGEEMILIEGNIGSQNDADDIHGTHDMNTLFRNYFNGFEPNNGTATSVQTSAVHLGAFSRYFNVIGNVLGTSGYHTSYQCLAPNASTSPCAVQFKVPFDLGYSGNTQGQIDITIPPTPDDPLAGSTLMRWGNYDVVRGAVSWCGNSSDTGWSGVCASASEVPTAISNYPNPVPTLGDTHAGQGALPASFFYPSRPAWLPANYAWPMIGPEVTSGNILQCTSGEYQWSLVLKSSQCAGGGTSGAPVMAGHAVANLAMICYLSVMNGPPDGTGPLLTFNAETCYYPRTPGSLTATPH